MMWMKKVIVRGASAFANAVAINILLALVLIKVVDKPGFLPMLPEYAEKFSSDMEAFIVQCLLIGLTSMAFGAGSVIFEVARWSLVKQSIVYFIITTLVWGSVAVFCWGLGKYKSAFYSIMASYLIGYIISWSVQYKICKKEISNINQRLQELNTKYEK